MAHPDDATTGPRVPEPPAGVRPQTLMLTFLGDTVLGREIAVFSGSYLAVMDLLGVSEEATRSTLTRPPIRVMNERMNAGSGTCAQLSCTLGHVTSFSTRAPPRWSNASFCTSA